MQPEIGICVTPQAHSQGMITNSNAEAAEAKTPAIRHVTTPRCLRVPTPADLRGRAGVLPVAAPPRPTEVFALVVSSASAVAWSVVVAHPGGTPTTLGGCLEAELAVGVDQVLAIVRDVAACGPVALFTRQSALCDAVAVFDAVVAFPQSMAKHHYLGFAAQRELDAQLSVALRHAPRLSVAADGSWSRHTRTAGWAFLAEDGQFRQGSFDHACSPDAAELHAIWEVVRTFRGSQRLRTSSDSRHAISFIATCHKRRGAAAAGARDCRADEGP